ncbi:MAG: hypothetical protein RIQ99_1630 [Pseudomonadota bacterium]|jgi:hypothetical protein
MLVAIGWFGAPRHRASATGDGEPIGLFTTLPILWAEAGDIGALIDPQQAPHWARAELARRGPITALDTLAGPGGAKPGGAQPGGSGSPLSALHRLVVAQPRPLSGAENVALDAWVRGGGRLLLIADPALTEDSAFPIGDPRRPQVTVLLSPILARWGLELQFDQTQRFGPVVMRAMGVAVPTNLAGRFVRRGASHCRLWAAGLAATCAIGQGQVTALADAAVLERDDPAGTRQQALSQLLDRALAAR